jgi:hypothetical protein
MNIIRRFLNAMSLLTTAHAEGKDIELLNV